MTEITVPSPVEAIPEGAPHSVAETDLRTQLEAITAERDQLRQQTEESAREKAVNALLAEHGLPAGLASFLVGDEATMQAQAAALAQAVKPDPLQSQPVEALRSAGQAPDSPAAPSLGALMYGARDHYANPVMSDDRNRYSYHSS
ncbi:hypothetical protein [Kitasatospora kifunensis]|uniref:Uncharacterized protein n=1 Tax=Kitasatospora kifunensis TaxID=58351 RepID=A0A7W7VUX0_KITKI|nr:hypothetical protein [Kitasatospora kifunensis]MBB4923772.1 hypothetical protein [Kitasatospora kifunensis]